MNVAALTPSPVKAADVSFEHLAANPNVPEREKVKEACRQFEAVLLRQILAAARKTVVSSSMNPENTTNGIYNDMITNQLADGISRTGAFGLAHSLEGQLVHQTLKSTAAAQDAGTDVILSDKSLNAANPK